MCFLDCIVLLCPLRALLADVAPSEWFANVLGSPSLVPPEVPRWQLVDHSRVHHVPDGSL